MTWVDRTVGEIEQRFAKDIAEGRTLIIRDEKTLSGRVHVGSLRGIVIHGLISQALTEKGIKNKFLFELNDFDPMDELPKFLDREKYLPYMGRPLFTVPAHEPVAENYPMVFGEELKGVVAKLGLPIEFYNLKPIYEAGKFNEVIGLALDHAKEIRDIYREVSGSNKPDDWFPFQVFCEQCGKVGTTQVTAWNGKEVTYVCKKDLVKWAEGCGNHGTISPFDGKGKLPWKVEWPAKWKVMGVDIEGAGKDHSAAGGSRQIGARIVEEVFKYPNPFDIPYEFFNIGGKKMSASKGLGASAKEISDLIPPSLLRLLMIRKLPNQPIDFDPEGTTIPTLFDEYDRLSDHYFKRHPTPDAEFARSFGLCQVDFPKPPKDLFEMRFSLVSFVSQMPHLNMEKEAESIKGSALNEDEKSELQSRSYYVGQWLKNYAPETAKYVIPNPPPAVTVSDTQKAAFAKLHDQLSQLSSWKGEDIHATLHTVKTEMNLEPKDLFAPLYTVFLNRTSGPQMGWFLSTFSKEDALQRISSLASS